MGKVRGINLLRAFSAIFSLSAAPSHATMPTIEDIVNSRRIDGLTLSPDGKRLAYRVFLPSLKDDRLSVQWREVSATGDSSPIDVGPPIAPMMRPLFSIPGDGTAQWGPDGESLFVVAPDSAGIQVHRLGPNGADTRVTTDPGDVSDFTLEPKSGLLRYHAGNSRASIAAALHAESQQGIHVDRSVITEGLRLTDNFRNGDRLTTIRRIGDNDVAGEPFAGIGHFVAQSLPSDPPATDTAPVGRQRTDYLKAVDGSTGAYLDTTAGMKIHISARDSSALGPSFQRYSVVAIAPGGRTLTCSKPACGRDDETVREVAANSDTGEIISSLEPMGSGPVRLVAWNPNNGKVRAIYDRQTVLDGGTLASGALCPRVDHYLFCVEAGPTAPERLVRIDMSNGALHVLDDPNAHLRSLEFPHARQIQWRTPDGGRASGVLVLPYSGERRPVPLVITTYRCAGFLRGGDASLAPEIILAQNGMAALCANSPDRGWGDKDEAGRPIPLAAHKIYITALRSIVDQLASEGLIDPARVGITGHSFSSNMVAFAISHTTLFRAAAVGGAFDVDPASYALTAATADSWRKHVFTVMGLPSPNSDPTHVWDGVSPATRSQATSAALLMQLPESEYALSMNTYAALQDAGVPSDMFVYPLEGHMVGAEPVHQYWRNRRAVDWFCFWLLGQERRTPETEVQYDHWEKLRRDDKRKIPTVAMPH